MKLKQDEVTKIRNYFSQKPETVAVYLYGSFARGDAKKNSDIDLGIILLKKKHRPFHLPQAIFADELKKITKKKVEIQDLSACSLEFCHRVLSEGKLIYGKDNQTRIDFEVQIGKKYFDFKPYIEEYYQHLSQIAKKGKLNVRYPTN